MIQAYIEVLQQQLDQINEELEPKGYSILETCPFIVASPDAFYSVSADDQNKVTIEFGQSHPTQFNPRAADDLVTNFKPCNGRGPIKLVKMNRSEFVLIRKESIELALANLTAIP